MPPPPPLSDLAEIVLRAPGIEVHVSPYGATVTKILVPDRDGVVDDVALGYDDLASYQRGDDRPYFGAIVGRVANRVANARFALPGKGEEGDGDGTREFALEANNGPNCLHGGVEGFDRRVWRVVNVADDGRSVTLAHDSPDGENGFPGLLKCEVTYAVRGDDENANDATDAAAKKSALLRTSMTAVAVGSATPVCLAQHSYFNLRGAASGHDVLAHEIRVFASKYTPVDPKTMIPTGELRSVEVDPGFDLRAPGARGFGEPLACNAPAPNPETGDPGGFDHNFALDGFGGGAGEGGGGGGDGGDDGVLHLCARARDPSTGRRLEVRCDQPGVQLYTGNFLSGARGKRGATYGKHAGFCLETQTFPDAVNQAERRGWATCVIEPGETYRHEMTHAFSVDDRS